jgi:hypothetical protein
MIKTIINNAIKAIVDELFVEAPSVQLSIGADLFSDSKINLSNLTFRPDIFDISLQPFQLVYGHLGSLNIEGIAELLLGGQLKFQAENIYLLFRIDEQADTEKVQTMKKILIELQTMKFSSVMLFELLRKLQGLNVPPDPDMKEKRQLMFKSFDSISKGMFLIIKNVHIRFEFGDDTLFPHKCNSFGIMLPLIKVTPASTQHRPEGLTKKDPCWILISKSIQAYIDYDRSSYEQDSHEKTTEYFKRMWREEVHTAIIIPFDFEFILGINLKRRTGLICPIVVMNIPALKLVIDPKQMEVLEKITISYAKANKKYEQNMKIQKIFRKGFPLPRMYEIGGIRFLPHLSLRGEIYPNQCDSIPQGEGPGLVAFMKDRVGNQWKIMLWKHIIRLVIHDLQMTRPLGRWVEMIRLLRIRKDYAFLYSKLIKVNTQNAFYIFF